MGDPVLTRNPEFGHIQDKLMTFNETKDDLTDKIDFCVCLGGDGTLLYASSLFQQSVPPIMAFHLGSLGFLTPFKFEDFESQVLCCSMVWYGMVWYGMVCYGILCYSTV